MTYLPPFALGLIQNVLRQTVEAVGRFYIKPAMIQATKNCDKRKQVGQVHLPNYLVAMNCGA